MELKELAKKIGVKNVLITHYNSTMYKDFITVILTDNLIMNLIGKTVYFIPTSITGIDMEINKATQIKILNYIKDYLNSNNINI